MNDMLYQAIADANRRHILDLLRRGPLPAGEIVAHLPHISQPAVSKHLRVLRDSQLVDVEPAGRQRLYRLNAVALQPVVEWLLHYDALWDQRLATLKQIAEGDS